MIGWFSREREGREGGSEDGGGGERDHFVVPLTYAFIGWCLHVPWPGIEPSTLAYWDNTLTNQVTLPRPLVFLYNTSNFCNIGSNGLSFISDSSNLSQKKTLCFFKELISSFLYVLCCFSILLISTLIFTISFFLLAPGSDFVLLFQCLKEKDLAIDSRSFFFRKMCIYNYKFPSNYCFSCIPQILVYGIFIFMHIKVFSDFSFEFFFDPLVMGHI